MGAAACADKVLLFCLGLVFVKLCNKVIVQAIYLIRLREGDATMENAAEYKFGNINVTVKCPGGQPDRKRMEEAVSQFIKSVLREKEVKSRQEVKE